MRVSNSPIAAQANTANRRYPYESPIALKSPAFSRLLGLSKNALCDLTPVQIAGYGQKESENNEE